MNGAELGCGRPPQQSFPVACSYASTRWFKANSPLGHIGNSCARAFPRKPGHTKDSVEQGPYGIGLATARTFALYTLAILTPTRGLYASMILSLPR